MKTIRNSNTSVHMTSLTDFSYTQSGSHWFHGNFDKGGDDKNGDDDDDDYEGSGDDDHHYDQCDCDGSDDVDNAPSAFDHVV